MVLALIVELGPAWPGGQEDKIAAFALERQVPEPAILCDPDPGNPSTAPRADDRGPFYSNHFKRRLRELQDPSPPFVLNYDLLQA